MAGAERHQQGLQQAYGTVQDGMMEAHGDHKQNSAKVTEYQSIVVKNSDTLIL